MERNRGQRVVEMLRDSKGDGLKRFSGLIVLMAIFIAEPVNTEELKNILKKLWEKLDRVSMGFHFDFGTDHDPHRPRRLNVEDFIKSCQEFNLISIVSLPDGSDVFIEIRGITLIFENLKFFQKYLSSLYKKN